MHWSLGPPPVGVLHAKVSSIFRRTMREAQPTQRFCCCITLASAHSTLAAAPRV
jgi:hypothetical protein